MNESKIQTTTGMCVVALTKYIMKKEEIDYEKAYKMLLHTELYQLLQDSQTGLFLETNEYLAGAYDKESESGIDALYEYIK